MASKLFIGDEISISDGLLLRLGDGWREEVNPARVGYLKKKLFSELKVNPQGKAALEIGEAAIGNYQDQK